MTVLSRFEAVRNYWMPRDTSVDVDVAVKDIDWVLHEIQRLKEANTKLVGALDQIHSVLNGEGDPQDLHLLVNEAIRAALQQTEPVPIPGAIPMSEIAARSRSMPERAEALEAARERLAGARAIATLKALGYTDEGGELWKPPLGKPEQAEPVDKALTNPEPIVDKEQAEPVVDRKKPVVDWHCSSCKTYNRVGKFCRACGGEK